MYPFTWIKKVFCETCILYPQNVDMSLLCLNLMEVYQNMYKLNVNYCKETMSTCQFVLFTIYRCDNGPTAAVPAVSWFLCTSCWVWAPANLSTKYSRKSDTISERCQ